MHWMSILGLILITLGGFFSFFGSQLSDRNSQRDLTDKIQEKNVTIDNINANNVKLIEQNSDLIASSKDVSVSNQQLIVKNEEMLLKVTQYQAEIEKKDSIIRELQQKVSRVERGIESKIEFNGSIRTRQGGSFTLSNGGAESQAFEAMVTLERAYKFSELLSLYEQSIRKHPTWYTPYIFKATALLNLDATKNKSQALACLDFAAARTTGDITFVVPITRILLLLKERTRIKDILKDVDAVTLSSIPDDSLRQALIEIKD
jgi:hypothetical protein